MTRHVTQIMLVIILALGCGQVSADYRIVETKNPEFRPNTVFGPAEDLSSPAFARIVERYKLRDVVLGGQDEFARILLLRGWLHNHIVKDGKSAASTHDAEAILEHGPEGGRYSCGHFETAQSAVMSAMGYVTRCIISGPDGEDPRRTGSHGSNEVWCNELCKWVLIDAELNSHFERNGVPLSALELRDTYLLNGGEGVTRMVGLERTPAPKSRFDEWGMTPRAYVCISWRWQTNRLTIFPDKGTSDEVVYYDEFFRTHTWHRGGRPHWAYAADAFRRVTDRSAIEWTPGVVDVRAGIDGEEVLVELNSDTPNLMEYQITDPGGQWETVEKNFRRPLTASRHEWRIRTLNTAGVAGPEYYLVVEKQ